MNLTIRIRNIFAWVRMHFTKEPYFTNADGSRVPMDDWEGYDSCMRPGCGHYRCEHSFGETYTTVYSKDETMTKVGDKLAWPVGCMNAGCKCDGFWTMTDLMKFMNNLAFGRSNGRHHLYEVPGVEHVESNVEITLHLTSYTKSREAEARYAIYEVEKRIMLEYPGIQFDFQVRWDDPPAD